MEQFSHLKFVQKFTGKPRFHGGGGSDKSLQNKSNRQAHSTTLQQNTQVTKSDWNNSFESRKSQNLASLDQSIIPIFLQINPDLLINPEFNLEAFGIEIISEEKDGYIIGASLDNFRNLETKITAFLTSEHGSGKIADFWGILNGKKEEWKPKHILSESLFAIWHEIDIDGEYQLEVSIAFAKPLGKEPDSTKQGGITRLAKYRKKLEERDDLLMKRETHFENFINHYGEITSSIIHLDDCFGCQVLISGKGLKDLVVNYQFVFEVSEVDEVTGIDGSESDVPNFDLEILPPDDNASEIGVIDSGIMEAHRYLALAIKDGTSKSYLDSIPSTADKVRGGGHGTKVAGAILYPYGISHLESPYKLPCFIRNLRVLNNDNFLPHKYPAALMQDIVHGNQDCKLFNLSISSNSPYRTKHMSTWAAVIDKLTFEEEVLFLIAVGNINFGNIQNYLNNDKNYPEYLKEKNCRLANPSQSSFSLSVGSINQNVFEDDNWSTLGKENDISAFSRIGPGIWGKIKPDVVEYGGGIIFSKNGSNLIKEHKVTSPELIRSTLYGGKAYGKDTVGTSFSTPKVAHIAALLKQMYPDETINLIRALIVQGARLPKNYFLNPTNESIRHYGYGLPSLERVTKNTDYRITFYNTEKIKAEECHIFSIKIPEHIRNQGDEFNILLEVTLSYTAQVRKTRQKTKSYLSTWLDWKASKIGEPFNDFKNYILKEHNNTITDYDSEERGELNNFNWKIRTRSDYGEVQQINRNNSSLQKDWAFLKSYELPEEIGLAVRGHKGWDKNKNEIPYAITISIEILNTNIPIYESIRVKNEIEIEV